MPSAKKAVSFRPDPDLDSAFNEALREIAVDGDDRRGGFGARPADCVTKTTALEALMGYFVAAVNTRHGAILNLPRLKAKGARWRTE